MSTTRPLIQPTQQHHGAFGHFRILIHKCLQLFRIERYQSIPINIHIRKSVRRPDLAKDRRVHQQLFLQRRRYVPFNARHRQRPVELPDLRILRVPR